MQTWEKHKSYTGHTIAQLIPAGLMRVIFLFFNYENKRGVGRGGNTRHLQSLIFHVVRARAMLVCFIDFFSFSPFLFSPSPSLCTTVYQRGWGTCKHTKNTQVGGRGVWKAKQKWVNLLGLVITLIYRVAGILWPKHKVIIAGRSTAMIVASVGGGAFKGPFAAFWNLNGTVVLKDIAVRDNCI